MKKKKFVLSLLRLSACLASLSLLSSSAFALAGEGVKVLKTKIVCKKGPCDAVAIGPALLKGAEHYVFAKPDDSSYPVHYPGTVFSSHSVNLKNDTDKTQRLSYTFEIKVDEEFMQFWREVEIRPGGHAVDSLQTRMRAIRDTAGQYEIEASTKLEGASTAYDRKTATLTIREEGKQK